MRMENKTIYGRVECLGTGRDQFERQLNEEFGKENWGYGWLVDIYQEEHGFVTTLLDRDQVTEHYFDAYAIFAQQFPWIFKALSNEALEIFEVDPENDVTSGADFSVQTSASTHYMDIAIRRVLKMYKLEFKGTQKININDGGDSLPADLTWVLPPNITTWFDLFNPSKLKVSQRIKPSKKLANIQLLTDPCGENWAQRPTSDGALTAESLYQFT